MSHDLRCRAWSAATPCGPAETSLQLSTVRYKAQAARSGAGGAGVGAPDEYSREVDRAGGARSKHPVHGYVGAHQDQGVVVTARDGSGGRGEGPPLFLMRRVSVGYGGPPAPGFPGPLTRSSVWPSGLRLKPRPVRGTVHPAAT